MIYKVPGDKSDGIYVRVERDQEYWWDNRKGHITKPEYAFTIKFTTTEPVDEQKLGNLLVDSVLLVANGV